MNRESDTEFLAKHPYFRAALNACLKRLETLAVAAAILIYQNHRTHDQIWTEAGPHLQDLVEQVQHLEIENDGQIETNNQGK